jgi:UDP-N-acetylglucosamine--N-acetylmuramyl-(pentapeptide) pyrophosphoryl-undecaprenol N-acetylglucosamine transferase
MRFVIAGGGTTGHLSPGVAVADELKKRGAEILFIGSAKGPESRIVPNLGYRFRAVRVEGRGPGLLTPRNVRAGVKMSVATAQCVAVLRNFRPAAVVGTGGYASLPAAFAARLLRIPLVLHEQNSVPGLANRVASRFAARVGVSFPGTEKLLGPTAVLVGNPVRPALVEFDKEKLRPEGLAEFRLMDGRPTLLVFGGSQGAQSINLAAAGAYDGLRSYGIQVLHLAGPEKAEATAGLVGRQVEEGDKILYTVLGYTDSMELAYACADLALCRSGASTIAELAAVGLPAVLVPLPISLDDDQRQNAQAVVEVGGGRMMLDRDLSSKVVVDIVQELLLDRLALDEMAKGIATLARRDAAERFADLVMEASP